MSEDDGSPESLSWQVLLKLRGETPRWDRQRLENKLLELAEFLSNTMSMEVSVLAFVCESPPTGKSSHGGFVLPRKT